MEDTAVQVVWPHLPGPSVELEIGDQLLNLKPSPPATRQRKGHRKASVPLPPGAIGGPGAVTIGGLRPATSYDLVMSGPGVPRTLVERVTTLRPPPGRLLDTFATINDLHLGEPGFDVTHTLEDSWPLESGRPYAWRCVEAAAEEAIAWGADALIVKGDMTAHGAPAEFHEVGRVLGRLRVPVMATLGNHEYHDPATDGRPILATYGINVPRQPWVEDRPGLRLIFGLTSRPFHRSGQVDDDQRSQLVSLAAGSPNPVFLVLHHQLQRFHLPTEYPPGVEGRQARALLDELAAANPAAFVTSGHTHRHRRRRYGPVEIVEVGSTKDYPGTWAGYAVYEGGIRQVVRRIAAPDVIAWTEGTASAVGGVWRRWSPGQRDDRCFSHRWPPRPSALSRDPAPAPVP
ncbi:MAG: metallophosphoesterase family protein [Acidimicrobiales bacterium]